MKKANAQVKVAVANRGEVAVRVLQACQELGYATVLLHSECDVHSYAYRLADEVICIGPAPASESYLNIASVVSSAKAMGAQLVHPGFGFLSENADFAQACLDEKLVFVGPSPLAMRQMGDKVQARACAEQVGVPVIPGFQSEEATDNELEAAACRIGFPVIIKVAGGGGGRGLKVARAKDEFATQLVSARREGEGGFGTSAVFLEKYLEKARHIECQVFGDAHGHIFSLMERDCSLQRRHQKIIEEAGESVLAPSLRERISGMALKVAQAVDYVGAGTVEFLVEGDQIYFLEMNTRLQVEHPVTELTLGVDLVQAQLRVALGERLSWQAQNLFLRGHAMECRLYAEDFVTGFPSTGRILAQKWFKGPGVRVDYGFEVGDEITSNYDSMLSKLIVFGETREVCIRKMYQVLCHTIIFGVHTKY